MHHEKPCRSAAHSACLAVFGSATLVIGTWGCSGAGTAPSQVAAGGTASGATVSSSSLGGKEARARGGASSGGSGARFSGSAVSASGGSPSTSMDPSGGTVATGFETASVAPSAGGSTSAGGFSNSTSASQVGGTKATGGTTNSGGSRATSKGSNGGASAGGAAAGGSVTGGNGSGGNGSGGNTNDRCDVGVYDSSSPPKVLTLSGNLGTHDPSAIESNGRFYLYATGLGAKTSNDLTSWQASTRPFAAPSWAKTSVPGVTDLWAPDISFFGGKYHLYYSASTFGSNRSCIGQATRDALDSGSWQDQGSVVCSNVTTTDNWNAIDPNVVLDTDATPWLVLGSFWSGIKILRLDQNGARVGTAVTSIANRPNDGGALEGPFMVRRCGYYYLFTSFDTCCKGANSTYNIRVGRASSVTGPFTDKAGTALLQGGGTLVAKTGTSWVGPGGQSVILTGTKAYLVYHAYASSDGAATLRIADLVWDSSGWPVPVGP